MKLIQKGNVYDIQIPTYYCESESELTLIPDSAPNGTIVEVLTTDGLIIKMKRSTGWINV